MSELTAWCLVISSSLLCSVITALVVHYLTEDRDAKILQSILDREANLRRRHLRAVLIRWKVRFQRSDQETLLTFYREFAVDIPYDAGVTDLDFTDRGTFNALVAKAYSFKKEDIEPDYETGRKTILSAIDALVRFVEAA